VVRQLLVDTLQYGAILASGSATQRFYWRGQLSILLGYLHEDYLEWHAPEEPLERRARAGTQLDRVSPELTEETAVRFYDERYAAGYMDEWPAWKKRRVATLIRELNLPPTGHALDYGCGQGVFTQVLREALPGWTISGTDVSGAAVDAASRRFPDCRFFRLPAAAPAESLACFDLLFTHHVLEHVINIERTWDQMASFLKPGGAMLHVLPCGNDHTLERRICTMRWDGIDRRRGNRFFFEDEGHVRRFDSAELEAAARRYGFAPGTRRFANAYWGAIEWITEAGPDWVRLLTDGAEARDASAKGSLRRLRYALLLLSVARMPAVKLAGVAKEPSSPKRSAKLAASLAGYPLAWGVERFLRAQAEREWQSAGTGSEMYLSFFRRGAAPQLADTHPASARMFASN
jgi:SAM-dependent methyltransferase